MAGYIFNLNSLDSLRLYAENGVYSTKLSISQDIDHWRTHHEGTFADYASMKPGDNIYFFIKRKIYGIGKLIEISSESDNIKDCKFNNFPNASKPQFFSYSAVKDQLLWDEGSYSNNQRWICCFTPDPYFYKNGIDMDEALSSHPIAFKMLRAFWKVSFIKIDDEENLALKSVILRKNKDINKNTVFDWNSTTHQKIKEKLTNDYKLNVGDIVKACFNEKKQTLTHEAAIEAYIIYHLSNKTTELIDVFGNWDYIARQVVASPFKPVDYMDKMDIFGYAYIVGYAPVKSKYLVIELKKDIAKPENIDQTMKYIDWVKDEYAYGDYSLIEGYLVAKGFSEQTIKRYKEVAKRTFTVGMRPVRTLRWDNLHLVRYKASKENERIKLFFHKLNMED